MDVSSDLAFALRAHARSLQRNCNENEKVHMLTSRLDEQRMDVYPRKYICVVKVELELA